MQKYKRNIKIGERGMGHSWQFLRGVAQYTLQYSGIRQQLIDQSYLTQYSEIFWPKLFWVWIIGSSLLTISRNQYHKSVKSWR